MNLNNATEIIARREFSPVYIIFDAAFLLFFAAMLIIKKKYMTVLVGALAGIMWSGLLKKNGIKFSFRDFIVYGATVSVPSLITCLAVLGLVL